LIAIMLPSLSSVRETAHQVVCRSNVRQLGYGIAMFTDAHNQSIPRTATLPTTDLGTDISYETMTLRYADSGPIVALLNQPATDRWDGLGRLYINEYLPAQKVFYCLSHKGEHPYSRYEDAWANNNGEIVGNYQYRGQGPTGRQRNGHDVMTTKLNLMRPGAALVSDGLRSQSDFNHVIGTNLLRADLSVAWFNDSGRTVVDMLPTGSEQANTPDVDDAWTQFDHSDRSVN
jgi:hypothetical protein